MILLVDRIPIDDSNEPILFFLFFNFAKVKDRFYIFHKKKKYKRSLENSLETL